MAKLTNKQQVFIIEYLKSFNATQSAIEAGYSERTARQQGSRLLSDVNISAAIDLFLEESAMSASEVLYHLTDIARGGIDEVIGHYGEPDIGKARENSKTRLIHKIKTRTVYTKGKTEDEDAEIHHTEIEMYDRLRALDMLAKYHDLTNRTKTTTWRDDIIADIRADKVSYGDVKGLFDESLAAELFAKAGRVVVTTDGG